MSDYVNQYVFPVLLPAMTEMLEAAEESLVFQVSNMQCTEVELKQLLWIILGKVFKSGPSKMF